MSRPQLLGLLCVACASSAGAGDATPVGAHSKAELRIQAATPGGQAEAAEGARRVADLTARLPAMTPEQLVAAFFTAPEGGFAAPVGADAYLWRDGNRAIEAELAGRGPAARPALEACRADSRDLFTGWNGPSLRVGTVCARLLALPASAGCHVLPQPAKAGDTSVGPDERICSQGETPYDCPAGFDAAAHGCTRAAAPPAWARRGDGPWCCPQR